MCTVTALQHLLLPGWYIGYIFHIYNKLLGLYMLRLYLSSEYRADGDLLMSCWPKVFLKHLLLLIRLVLFGCWDRIIDFSLRYFNICYANSANSQCQWHCQADEGLCALPISMVFHYYYVEYQQMSIDLHGLVVFV